MIVSVEKAAAYIGTANIDLQRLEDRLLALEASIRNHTNNNFQNRKFRFYGTITEGSIFTNARFFKSGDTIQVSGSNYNDGLYVIKGKTETTLTFKEPLYDEEGFIMITKIEYPEDVKEGVLKILRWQYKNENQNYNPDAEKEVQSETISRHSVTYAKDATESDLDSEFGVPKKYVAFLKHYMKARF